MLLGTKHSEETKKKIALARTKSEEDRAIFIRQGYRYIFKPKHPNADGDGYVAEHTIVMSEHLDRLLRKGEHIHHINHNRLDNRIENLRLHTPSSHMKEHRQEYINQYIHGRTCGQCHNDKTTVALVVDKRSNNKFWHAYWRRSPLDKNMWLCNTCWRAVYYSIKKK